MDTLEQYEALVEKICHWSVEEMGVCAFKNTEMYFRRLDYKPRTFQEAAPCYKADRSPEESRILSDYQCGIICRMAAKLNVPIQIHTGSIWGDFVPSDISPEHLATIIAAHPDTKFDLLHGGDPFYGTTALMGNAFPNVFVNLSGMPNSSYADFRHWLSVYLDRVPSHKLILGWDEFAPEMVAGDAVYTRDILAQVLADKVDGDLLSMELALEIAHDVMHRTAEKLFQIA
jgi:predicted TIM-barrel fold metal-dependent hydrolase